MQNSSARCEVRGTKRASASLCIPRGYRANLMKCAFSSKRPGCVLWVCVSANPSEACGLVPEDVPNPPVKSSALRSGMLRREFRLAYRSGSKRLFLRRSFITYKAGEACNGRVRGLCFQLPRKNQLSNCVCSDGRIFFRLQ